MSQVGRKLTAETNKSPERVNPIGASGDGTRASAGADGR
ncbi:hypothetical protein FTUN_4325 [Frigoriglobus tundricola]|uniref:Uncharacterized protein n=1 Tax=Frigoriglobus tundricola TaxID=2774151 RepID=A0A6M5YTL6_9BACT|nr:hypothetical protein FTUN_4325 [Frigoriglobus tundricola]